MVEIFHRYNDNHILVTIQIKELLTMNLTNWKYNRPPDEIRCTEITKHYTKTNTEILQPFYFHHLTENDEYEILDGIHRYTALTIMENKGIMEKKIVLIHIFTDQSDGFLIDIFQNLNKTVPVPNLYISANNNDTEKEIVEHVTKDWVRKYPSHFSPNSNCNVPNINRDTFIDLLTDLYKMHKTRSKEKLEELLQAANEEIKQRIENGYRDNRIKFSEKQKEKCVKTGCYLFLYRPDIIKTIIN